MSENIENLSGQNGINVEFLMNAFINFNNAQKMMPALQQHPIYQMALEQLKNGLGQYAVGLE